MSFLSADVPRFSSEKHQRSGAREVHYLLQGSRQTCWAWWGWDVWNLAHRTGEAECADSGGGSEIWCRENKIPQPYAAHRSAVGLFPLMMVQINYDHHVSSPGPHKSH